MIARGRTEVITNAADKIHGLKILMKHQTGRDFDINVKMAETVNVILFVADELTAKAKGDV